jgi:hypothetical protein
MSRRILISVTFKFARTELGLLCRQVAKVGQHRQRLSCLGRVSETVVKTRRERHRQGGIRKVSRAKGFAWEYRYSIKNKRRAELKTETFGWRFARQFIGSTKAFQTHQNSLSR